jgi:hypothetical protein
MWEAHSGKCHFPDLKVHVTLISGGKIFLMELNYEQSRSIIIMDSIPHTFNAFFSLP